jgi:hypothetical protein
MRLAEEQEVQLIRPFRDGNTVVNDFIKDDYHPAAQVQESVNLVLLTAEN